MDHDLRLPLANGAEIAWFERSGSHHDALPTTSEPQVISIRDIEQNKFTTFRSPSYPMKLNRIVPMLPVKSIAASIAFYQKLGFSVERKMDEWGWAHLRFGACELMIDQSINLHPHSPRSTVVYLYPDDIAAFHAAARKNGLNVPDLDVTFYGMTEFRIDDPDGNRLWIGQDLSKTTQPVT